jgi:hypothetical protein
MDGFGRVIRDADYNGEEGARFHGKLGAASLRHSSLVAIAFAVPGAALFVAKRAY